LDAKLSIDMLNKGVGDELQAIHQYMYWHFHLDDQGFGPLSGLFRKIAISEMVHLEKFAERILFLKGDVEMKPTGPVEKITEPQKILQRAAEMELDAATTYNKFSLKSSENEDAASKQLFEESVADEEGHYDLFDKQLENIKRFGPNYLALQSFGAAAEEKPASQ